MCFFSDAPSKVNSGALLLAAIRALGLDPTGPKCPRSAVRWGRAETFAFDDEDMVEALLLEQEINRVIFEKFGHHPFFTVDFDSVAELVGPVLARVALLRCAIWPRVTGDGCCVWSSAPEDRECRSYTLTLRGHGWTGEKLRTISGPSV